MRKKFLILTFVSFIGLIILNGAYFKIKEKYEKHLGIEYIIQKDTVTVIDYSIIQENFLLSNGQTVNSNIIFNLKK